MIPTLTDTHCHLNLIEPPTLRTEVIERAVQAGVRRILVPGFDLPSSEAAIALAETHDFIFAAVGIHPNHAAQVAETDFTQIESLALHPKVVCIGEIGLDYYRSHESANLQKRILEQHLDLASRLNKPVSIHIRDSWEDCWQILSAWQVRLHENGLELAKTPGVLHSFSGTSVQATLAHEQHFRLGISGPVTYKSAALLQEAVQKASAHQILIETDSPYLPPQSYRGKMNEPAYTWEIVQKIAQIRSVDPLSLSTQTADNAATLFSWGEV